MRTVKERGLVLSAVVLALAASFLSVGVTNGSADTATDTTPAIQTNATSAEPTTTADPTTAPDPADPAGSDQVTSYVPETLDVNVGSVTGAGSISVYVDQYGDYDAQGIPQTIREQPVETVPVSGGGDQQLTVPVTQDMLEDETDSSTGADDTLQLDINYGDELATASSTLDVPADFAVPDTRNVRHPAKRAAFAYRPLPTVQVRGYFHNATEKADAAQPDSPVPPPCAWAASGGAQEVEARLGQMTVSSDAGASGVFNYGTQADSTFGVLFSTAASPNQNVSESGTDGVSNSIATNADVPVGAGYDDYIDGHVYYQTYASNINPNNGQPACGNRWMTAVVRAAGDAFQGTNAAPGDPYGRCGKDPNGLATISNGGGTYSETKTTGTTFGSGLSIFGVGVSASTGYTSNISVEYVNHTSGNMYACGNAELPDSPTLWSNGADGN